MSEYTIGSTTFVSLLSEDKIRALLAEKIIKLSIVKSAKFVLMKSTHDQVLSLLVMGGSGLSHLDLAKRCERGGLGTFFGAGKLKNIGKDKDTRTAEWNSYTCESHYGFSTPQNIDEESLTRILEEVKLKAYECLDRISRGEESS